MTARELIALTDELRPNALSFERKLQWLNRLEKQVFEEILSTHQMGEGKDFEALVTGEEELAIPEPYSEVYHYYLCMQMALTQRELVIYNNDRALFTAAYLAWQDRVNRQFLPLGAAERFKV